MTTHMTATRDKWLEARLDLLAAEKDLTRRSDEVARLRQRLPWVRVDKAYRFETDDGNVSLADLFQGRSQLLVYHFMFGPDYKAGCASCSSIADGFNGIAVHLANHDVMFWAASRAPLPKLQAFRQRMGWTFPWASTVGGAFNFDFNVSFTEAQQRDGDGEYNYRSGGGRAMVTTKLPEAVLQNAAMTGADALTFMRERPDAELLIVGRSDASICLATALTAYDRGVATALVDDAILAAAHERQGFGALVDLTRRSGRRGVRIEAAERLLRLRPAFRVVQGGLAHSATG